METRVTLFLLAPTWASCSLTHLKRQRGQQSSERRSRKERESEGWDAERHFPQRFHSHRLIETCVARALRPYMYEESSTRAVHPPLSLSHSLSSLWSLLHLLAALSYSLVHPSRSGVPSCLSLSLLLSHSRTLSQLKSVCVRVCVFLCACARELILFRLQADDGKYCLSSRISERMLSVEGICVCVCG